MRIRPAAVADAAAIAAIYGPYVTSSAVSFETAPPDAAEIRDRMGRGDGRYPWLVAEDDGDAVIGYAYAGPFRTRAAYRFSVETSVYLDPSAHGRGVARSLYTRLLELLEMQRYTQAIATIALPNLASIRLHEALGFVASGVYRQVGYKHGLWHDVGVWQRTLASPRQPPEEPLPAHAMPG